MNINETICGFVLKSRTEVAEISAAVNIFEHKKSGAQLCFVDREDENLSFAIGFKTPPEDSTGVFHIIEHSTLCGSRKFPVKEPFVELLKGSLNTFLNAMTYEDKTVYPVSSRCKKDFYNLVDIYLDAVFHPLMLEDEKIFMQEGHHLEYDEDCGALSHSGVVYNEMLGAYSSAEELSDAEMSRLLFSGSIYGHDSGGAPDAIPSLTYGQFCEAHKKYYRPENAYIVIDGSLDLEAVLTLIDSYLSEYEREGFSVSFEYPAPRVCPMQRLFYEAGEDDDGTARLMFSSVSGRVEEREKLLAVTLLTDTLAGSNEAPLKKALLDSGLCEDVSVYANKSLVNCVTLELHGIEAERAEELTELVKRCIEDIASRGIDKHRLRAGLDRIKFRLREKDYGSFPRGVAFALSILEVWLYGIDPAEALVYEDTLSALEGLIDTDYFERLLLELTVNSAHRASLLMLPSDGPSEMTRRIKASLRELEDSLSPSDIEKIKLADAELKRRQATPDTPEALSRIPKLTLEDISRSKRHFETEISDSDGAKIFHHKLDTSGILYTELYFSAENLTGNELTLLTLLSSLLTNLDTEEYTASELKNEIKGSLGSFSPNALAFTDTENRGDAIPLFSLSVSALAERAEAVPRLVSEVLLRTKFDNTEKIKQIITQIRSATEDSVLSNGDGISTERVEGALTEAGAVNEEILGITAYKRLKEYEKSFAEKGESIKAALAALAKKLFVKSRLTVGIAGDMPGGFAESLLSAFPVGEKVKHASAVYKPEKRREAVVLPIRVSHAAMGICSDKAASLLGALKVARSVLSYEYLWNEVRVMGGAYGTGLVARRHGSVLLYSYRDPSPARTLEIFRRSAEFLRKFADSGVDLTKYIIGAIGEYDILTTPRTAASQATADLLTGWSNEKEERLFSDMLSCNADSLKRVADLLDALCSDASYTVVCGRDMLESLGDTDVVVP